MVNIKDKPEFKIVNGAVIALMVSHKLRVKKDAPTFKTGAVIRCWIALYDNGRYAVWSISHLDTTYHVFESRDELNEHFDEIAD